MASPLKIYISLEILNWNSEFNGIASCVSKKIQRNRFRAVDLVTDLAVRPCAFLNPLESLRRREKRQEETCQDLASSCCAIIYFGQLFERILKSLFKCPQAKLRRISRVAFEWQRFEEWKMLATRLDGSLKRMLKVLPNHQPNYSILIIKIAILNCNRHRDD